MDLLIKVFADLAKQYIVKTPNITLNQLREELFKLNPALRDDKIFCDIFPTIFELEKCKSEKYKSENCDSK